jgi:uncharacterized membrane protein YoaK (UPF0700 family)
VLLCLVGGAADAIAYLNFGTFVGAMTGNTVLLGIDVADGQFAEAFYHVCVIAAFSTAIVVTQAGRLRRIPAGLPLIVGAIMLAGSQMVHDKWSALISAAALGVQNAAVRKIGGISINTVFVTGNLLRLGAAMPQADAASQRNVESVLATAWIAYAAGAAVGAAARHALSYPMLLPAMLMLIAAIIELRNPSRLGE